MDRNEGIIKWSPNPSRSEFMTINLNYRVVQIYEATGHAQPGRLADLADQHSGAQLAAGTAGPRLDAFPFSHAAIVGVAGVATRVALGASV